MRTPPIAMPAIAPLPIPVLEVLGAGSLGGAVEEVLLVSDVEGRGTTEVLSELDGLFGVPFFEALGWQTKSSEANP
jgi:hypothetical protein